MQEVWAIATDVPVARCVCDCGQPVPCKAAALIKVLVLFGV